MVSNDDDDDDLKPQTYEKCVKGELETCIFETVLNLNLMPLQCCFIDLKVLKCSVMKFLRMCRPYHKKNRNPDILFPLQFLTLPKVTKFLICQIQIIQIIDITIQVQWNAVCYNQNRNLTNRKIFHTLIILKFCHWYTWLKKLFVLLHTPKQVILIIIVLYWRVAEITSPKSSFKTLPTIYMYKWKAIREFKGLWNCPVSQCRRVYAV